MKSILVRVLLAMVAFCVLALPCLAADAAVVTEYDMYDDQMIVYVKNAGEGGNLSASIGHTSCEGVSSQKLSETGAGMRTLILIDNSLSIPYNSRAEINGAISRILAARKNGEQFALGTISEAVSVVQEFTDDYTSLKSALDGIQYQDQETYITDALYDYLSENPFHLEQSVYTRILLFSDGVDNKSIGYTKDELLTILRSKPYPINAVGVRNAYNSNSTDIENMFSLARATGGATFLLNDLQQNPDALTAALATDWDILAVAVPLPTEVRDGSLQTLTLDFGGTKLSLDGVRMPNSPLPKATEAPAQTQAPAPQPTPAQEEPKPGLSTTMLILIIAGGVLLIGGGILAFVLLRKKGKKKSFNTISTDELKQKAHEEDSGTVLMGGGGGTEMMEGEATLHFWDNNVPVTNIVLTDVHDMQRRFSKPITTSLVIGLSSDCDIVINYDKTVSRRHCEISKEDDCFYITNLSTANGTIVNNNRITSKTRISDGAMIKMGRVEMRLEIQEY